MIIAIDGPAGSGKSTVAKELAKRLNISYLDTGAMYRGLTLAALDAKIDFNKPEELACLAEKTKLSFENVNGTNRLLINDNAYLPNGKLVDQEIRIQQVTDSSKAIASNAQVRDILVKQQQEIGLELNSLVTEGRDQTTIVFPEAKFKFYLDARPEERAKRRYEQLRKKGIEVNYEEILESQIQRDFSDKNRSVGALKVAPDAMVLDTSNMNVMQVVDQIIDIINQKEQSNAF